MVVISPFRPQKSTQLRDYPSPFWPWEIILDTTMTVATVGKVAATFGSTYRLIKFTAIGGLTANNEAAYITFNDSTLANAYFKRGLKSSGIAVTPIDFSGNYIEVKAAATGGGSFFLEGDLIRDAGTDNSRGFFKFSWGNEYEASYGGSDENPASSIEFVSGTAAQKFAIGSRFIVYGLK